MHEYRGKYYMLATFTQENGLRGTVCYARLSESLDRVEGEVTTLFAALFFLCFLLFGNWY